MATQTRGPSDGDGFTPDDAQVLENVLNDTEVRPRTRRWLIGAALGAGAAGALGPLGRLLAQGGGDTAETVGTTAVTAEALAVTYLSNLITAIGDQFPAEVGEILKAANTAEQAHYDFLSGAGFKPLATRFWVPDAAVTAEQAPAVIEQAETLFVNAYLIGTTVFAEVGESKLARYAAEIAGVEAQHRALARDLQGKLPNNVAFERYEYTNLDDVVGQITALGIGIGERGEGPGKFYEYSGPLPGTTTSLANAAPDADVPCPLPTASGQPVMTG